LPVDLLTQTADSGARLAIRLLQDAAQRGDIDPWDVDVIPVVDGFLDQLQQRIEPQKKSHNISARMVEVTRLISHRVVRLF